MIKKLVKPTNLNPAPTMVLVYGYNESTELARGILGSLRYMIVGLPALLVGIIVLIVAYIQRRK